MLKDFKKFVICLFVAVNFFTTIPVYASENGIEIAGQSERNASIMRAGVETLKYGSNLIGSFTFTNTNLSPVKTIPPGASALQFCFYFSKAKIDKGVGDVKLTVQIRKSNGTVVYNGMAKDVSSTYGATEFWTDVVNVKSGEKYQVWLDASSVNPAQSNGNFRSITVEMYSVVW